MISKSTEKMIHSLDKKKYREKYGLFVAEGDKLVSSLIHSQLKIKFIIATKEWLHKYSEIHSHTPALEKVTQDELKKISFLKTPNQVLALVEIPSLSVKDKVWDHQLTLVLDGINDPGNLGTIIRLADWFGIRQIICSEESVDVYNPKVIQSTMGAIANVEVFYTNLQQLFSRYSGKMEIIGTYTDGENLYKATLPKKGFIVFGNEARGISENLMPYVSKRVLIPPGNINKVSDSLNVSMATAIVCAEFQRQQLFLPGKFTD